MRNVREEQEAEREHGDDDKRPDGSLPQVGVGQVQLGTDDERVGGEQEDLDGGRDSRGEASLGKCSKHLIPPNHCILNTHCRNIL